MDSLFFEKQEGRLCAQHALNALLQGYYFTAPDLAEIANRLDSEEMRVMGANGGSQSHFMSHNMDDSGFFSIQVLGEALKIWALELVPLKSSSCAEAFQARQDPTAAPAYICNFREHWFTIRKFRSDQWFNLNSLFKQPELVSNTYLSLLLKQLENEGYSIFVIRGTLPPCQADEVLPLSDITAAAALAAQANREALAADRNSASATPPRSPSADDQDDDLARALQLSRAELDAADPTLQLALQQSSTEAAGHGLRPSLDEEQQLEKALRLSLKTDYEIQAEASSSAGPVLSTVEDMRQRRLKYFDKIEQDNKQ